MSIEEFSYSLLVVGCGCQWPGDRQEHWGQLTNLELTSDGKGEGFGNPISIQTVAIVKAAKALRCVYRTDTDRPV